MSAQEFLSQYGELKDANVHFVNAGNTVVKLVAELLEEYAAVLIPPCTTSTTVNSSPAKKRTPKKK